MAVLFSINNKAVPVGAVITNRAITAPAGVVAVTYTITVGTPPALTGEINADGIPTSEPAAPEDLTIWVEWQDGKIWRELSRFTTDTFASSTAVVTLQGRTMRVSATCGIATTVSLAVESANVDGTAR